MAKKPIRASLVWESLVWTFYQFSRQSEDRKIERPIRMYQPGDEELLAEFIAEVREGYRHEIGYKYARGGSRDFRNNVDVIADTKLRSGVWTLTTRNLMSSAVSTYITWDRAGIAVKNRRVIDELLPYASIFLKLSNKTAGENRE